MMKAIAITGPTASGKTELSLLIAERLSAEIISSDSMQIYKKMDIGTAKATPEERARVPHHLIDFLDPRETYSVEAYRRDALLAMEDISARGKLPLFVGGTGLYIDSLLRGESSSSPEGDPEYREKILASVKSEEDKTALWERLLSVDPESAEAIHKNNVKRVIRALEIYDKTGKPKSWHDARTRSEGAALPILMLTLDFHDREALYERINLRVDAMVKSGLVDEVRELYLAGMLPPESTASQAIGYKEMLSFIKGERSLHEACEEIKLASRRYAKRQLTWFRHKDSVRLFADNEDGRRRPPEELAREALEHINKFLER